MNESIVEISNNNVRCAPKRNDRRQMEFYFDIESIRVISVVTQVEFDEEELYLNFVNKEGVQFLLYSEYINTPIIDMLKNKFNYSFHGNQFSPEDYERGNSKVVYPVELVGKNLFRYDFGLRNIVNYLLRHIFLRHPAHRLLSMEVFEYLREDSDTC